MPIRVARDGRSYMREQSHAHYGPMGESHWHAAAGEAFFIPQTTLDGIFRLLRAKLKDKVLIREAWWRGSRGRIRWP